MKREQFAELIDWGTFFGLWLRRPLEIAAVLPSGPFLADAVGRALDLTRPGHVLELGAGTGSITAGLLRAGCPAERLVAIERHPPLAERLRRRFPAAMIIEGDARDLSSLLAARGVNRLACVASSLPITWFAPDAQRSVVEQCFTLMRPGGRLLQVTNAMRSPLPQSALGIEGLEIDRIWLNFLPSQIWSYAHASRSRSDTSATRGSGPLPAEGAGNPAAARA
jgi:phosphatidylethanolamine/phosphatidyl-N-methylethanolamine N-methyltransferase